MPPNKRSARSGRRVTAGRVVMAIGAAGATWFAIFAGEYSTVDLFRQRERRARLELAVDSLARAVDSLKRLRASILNDPVVQERIAREEFGMVRGNRELLYRFAEPDSAETRGRAIRSP